ncbi:SRPBCC domain-containing protein [Caulobacter sp. DWR1-3-2b1]|uniref:SRPBCC domain-containing protein n=1 Tax=Caulobacter sp. DWR1-3-2b1 TaxID=2804670 RepID=UPI003CF0E5B6
MADITHATFFLERVSDAAPARAFHAFTDPDARRRWFFKTDSWSLHAHSGGELAIGAQESSRFSPPGATVLITNDSIYLDVAPNERLIFAYAMTLGGAPLSSSLATVEFRAEGKGTRLVFTEQGAYLDGNVAGREEGTREMLELLAAELARAA